MRRLVCLVVWRRLWYVDFGLVGIKGVFYFSFFGGFCFSLAMSVR